MENSQVIILSLIGILSLFAYDEVSSIGVTPAFGQIQDPIVVTTDKASYSEGDTILVTGEVSQLLGGYKINFTVIAPNGNIVVLDQLTVGADKKFSTSFAAGGNLMKFEGTYTITVQYGDSKSRSAETSFEFGGVVDDEEREDISIVTENTVSIQGANDLIDYDISGAKLINIIPDVDALSLIVNIDAFNDGFITLILPRSIIDAKTGNDDSKFFILVDGEEKNYSEITTLVDRTIIIPFRAGSEEIEIIGTNFGNNETHISSIGLSITATAEEGSDTITVTGKTVSVTTDVTFRVTSPSGNNVISIKQVSPDDNGEFTVKFTVSSLWTEDGFYEIKAMQAGSANSLYALHVLVEVTGGMTEKTDITQSNLETGGFVSIGTGVTRDAGLEISVDAFRGSTTIEITGWTDRLSQDITLTVIAPNGNVVSIDRISPMLNGEFTSVFTTGGSLWKQDGFYTVTAQQFSSPLYTDSVEVDILDGVVASSQVYQPPSILDTTPPKILKPTDITVNAKNQNGAVVTFDVLTIDDTDKIVNTICNPSSNSFFQIGETRIVCNARDSSGNRAIPISFNITVNAAGSVIPEWVKNVAAFWCEDKIDDTSFIEGIQYLIDNEIITVSVTNSSSGFIQDIPQWVKNNACWWSKGLITDKEFTSGIEFLVKAGIIRV